MSVPSAPDRLAIVLTPFARPDVVAAACKQLGMTDAVAVPSRSGVVVTRPLPPRAEHTDWDIAELFGDAPATPAPDVEVSPDAAVSPGMSPSPGSGAGGSAAGEPGAGGTAAGVGSGAQDAATDGVGSGAQEAGTDGAEPVPADELTAADAQIAAPVPAENAGEELATAMSTITRRGVVLVTADLGLDTGLETGLAGHVVAREWNAGEPGKDVAPGLLIAGADDVVEDIILGRRAPDEIPGAIRAADVTGRGPRRRLFGRGD
ncbi:MAG: hypothetical protein ACTHXO_07315 [Actinomycetaceae bacterium]